MVFIIGNTVRPEGAPGVPDDTNDVLALVDADDKVYQPNDRLFHHDEYRILVTSSKKEARPTLAYSKSSGSVCGVYDGAMVARRTCCCIARAFRLLINLPAYDS